MEHARKLEQAAASYWSWMVWYHIEFQQKALVEPDALDQMNKSQDYGVALDEMIKAVEEFVRGELGRPVPTIRFIGKLVPRGS